MILALALTVLSAGLNTREMAQAQLWNTGQATIANTFRIMATADKQTATKIRYAAWKVEGNPANAEIEAALKSAAASIATADAWNQLQFLSYQDAGGAFLWLDYDGCCRKCEESAIRGESCIIRDCEANSFLNLANAVMDGQGVLPAPTMP